MRDPFAAALARLFRAPGSAAAVYTPAGGVSLPIRVIVGQADESAALGRARIVKGSVAIDIQRSDVAQPRPGDRLAFIDGTLARSEAGATSTLKLYGEAMLDAQGLTWLCGAVPA